VDFITKVVVFITPIFSTNFLHQKCCIFYSNIFTPKMLHFLQQYFYTKNVAFFTAIFLHQNFLIFITPIFLQQFFYMTFLTPKLFFYSKIVVCITPIVYTNFYNNFLHQFLTPILTPIFKPKFLLFTTPFFSFYYNIFTPKKKFYTKKNAT